MIEENQKKRNKNFLRHLMHTNNSEVSINRSKKNKAAVFLQSSGLYFFKKASIKLKLLQTQANTEEIYLAYLSQS